MPKKPPIPTEPADVSVKLTGPQADQMRATGLPMSAAFDKLMHRSDTTQGFIFASAATDNNLPGVPTTAIPTVDEPTLQMWSTMQQRVIPADHYMQEEAAQDDVFMILANIRGACTIGLWKLIAKDLEASEETIKDMYAWIDSTELLKVFTGGSINSVDKGAFFNWQVHGRCAMFVWYDGKAGGGEISQFVNLPVDGLRRFTNPRDPTKYYFFQKYKKEADWTNPESWDDVDSLSDEGDVPAEYQCVWYIEGGEPNRYATYKGTDDRIYPNIKEEDWCNELNDLVYLENPTPPLNDNIVTTIMNKRYLVRMSIVAVQLGIIPIYKLQFGTDDPKLFPPNADERIKDSNPVEYARQQAVVTAWKADMVAMVDNIDNSIRNGKPIAYQYGVTVERDEPHMAVTAEFISSVVGEYNQIIARAMGIPLSLIMALGVELATSALTKSVVDVSLLATQLVFHDVIRTLLKLKFAKEMDEQGIDVTLQPLDKADAHTSAEIQQLLAQATFTLKRAGATNKTLENFVLANPEMPLQKVDMSGESDLSDTVEVE